MGPRNGNCRGNSAPPPRRKQRDERRGERRRRRGSGCSGFRGACGFVIGRPTQQQSSAEGGREGLIWRPSSPPPPPEQRASERRPVGWGVGEGHPLFGFFPTPQAQGPPSPSGRQCWACAGEARRWSRTLTPRCWVLFYFILCFSVTRTCSLESLVREPGMCFQGSLYLGMTG